MKSNSRWVLLSVLFLLTIGAMLSWWPDRSSKTAALDSPAPFDLTSRGASEEADSIADRPLLAYQNELLDLAFRAASALPPMPHIKNRSRAQEKVVDACFELDQPRRALGYIEKIDNWRRGVGYAEFAFYCARHGHLNEVERYLILAEQISDKISRQIDLEELDEEGVQVESAQDWQRDRIRVKIASTHAWLGRTEQAARLEEGVVDSESGKVETILATRMSAEAFEEQLRSLETIVSTASFERARNAFETCAELFNRFYEDKERRSRAEETIKASRKKVPLLLYIELMTKLAGFALDHQDSAKTLELVAEAQALIEEHRWLAEHKIPLVAKLARLRYRAGDRERARSETDAALALFDSERENIVNIYRAGALRPIAENYQAMGDAAAALAVYNRAVVEGVENPNSRPRAEDLTATCISMALNGFEPDSKLKDRLLQVFHGLGEPW